MKKITVCLLAFFVGAFLFSANAQSTVYFQPSGNSFARIEGDTFDFTLKLNVASTSAITVNVITVPGTADATDYTPMNTVVTIPAGQLQSAMLSIPTTNDFNVEFNENFTISGTVNFGNVTNTSLSGSVGITDNDTPPTIDITHTAQFFTVNEFASSMSYRVTLSNPYNTPLTISLATSDGTTSAGDYVAVNTSITFPPGQTTSIQTISIVNDNIPEIDEEFTITATIISGIPSNPSASKMIRIRDNDTTPTLSIRSTSGFTMIEGSQGQFHLYLDRPFNSDIVIQFDTSDGTATSADYIPVTVTKTILANSQVAIVTIPTIDDAVDEFFETFNLNATVTSGNTTNLTSSKIVTIQDNDGLPDFIMGGLGNVDEGNNLYWHLVLTHVSPVDTVIQLTTNDGTATSADYTGATATVTIPAGQMELSEFSLIVPIILDQLQEPNETFTITGTCTSGNTFTTTETKTVTILDNYNVRSENDTFNPVVGVGGAFQVLTNDTLHGLPVVASDVTITLGANTIGATINSLGILTIPNTIGGFYYSMTYTICEIANPSNCSTGIIVIEVQPPLKVTYTVSYNDFNGDSYVNVGDLINCQFDVANQGADAITAIQIASISSELTISGGTIAQLNPGQTDTTTYTGMHIITQDDINFGNFQDGVLNEVTFSGTHLGNTIYAYAEEIGSFSLSTSDGVKLNAFVDTNANGVQEAGEYNFPLGHFNYEINNNGTIHNLYSSPSYLYETNPTTSYGLSYTVDSQYAAYNNCTISYSNITVAQGSGITTYNFPVTVTPYNDLSVAIHNYSAPPNPGFPYNNYITYSNNSSQIVPSGTLTFTKDAVVSIQGVSNGGVMTPTGFTYTFTNLLPYETRQIWVNMLIPTLPTVTLGQLITNSISMANLPGEILLSNNNSQLTQAIVGSYDPNIKTENHGGRIVHSSFTSNDYLTYTIQFENTGTANAINIRVEDELDEKLDETTLQMVDASAHYSLERVDSNLIWKFGAINLPPSVPNTTVGHGYLTFKIKPTTGYTIGDIIPNSAEIYFDYNPAIVTPICTTEFVATLSNTNFAFANFNYYPNPVKNSLSISNTSVINGVEITTVLGQQVYSQKVNSLETDINLSTLSKGIYFVKITSEDQEKTVKIIKE